MQGDCGNAVAILRVGFKDDRVRVLDVGERRLFSPTFLFWTLLFY